MSVAAGEFAYLNGEPVTVTFVHGTHAYYVRGHHSWSCADSSLFQDSPAKEGSAHLPLAP